MALAKGKFRLSCDYPKSVYEELDRISKKTQEKNSKINKSYILNELLNAFVSLDDDTASELVNMLKAKEQLHKSKAENSTGFIQQKEFETSKQYSKLAYIYSRFGETVPVTEDTGMKRYELNNGCVVVPKDWIAIDSNTSKEHSYAWVMEVKNGDHFFGGVPHFLGFFDSQRIDSDTEKKFVEAIKQVYPKLTDLENMYVEPKYSEPDENGNRRFINAKEWDAAPIIGVFNIREFDESNTDATYPLGAMIIRQK